jgi:hypothetical protein
VCGCGRKSPHNHAQTTRNLKRSLRNAAAGARLIQADGLDSKSAADVAVAFVERSPSCAYCVRSMKASHASHSSGVLQHCAGRIRCDPRLPISARTCRGRSRWFLGSAILSCWAAHSAESAGTRSKGVGIGDGLLLPMPATVAVRTTMPVVPAMTEPAISHGLRLIWGKPSFRVGRFRIAKRSLSALESSMHRGGMVTSSRSPYAARAMSRTFAAVVTGAHL